MPNAESKICLSSGPDRSGLSRKREGTTMPPLSLSPKGYSDDDIERFIRGTNLCKVCQAIFGSQEAWIPDPLYKDYFEHHPSSESLLLATKTGCLLCSRLYKAWRRDRSLFPPQPLQKPTKRKTSLSKLHVPFHSKWRISHEKMFLHWVDKNTQKSQTVIIYNIIDREIPSNPGLYIVPKLTHGSLLESRSSSYETFD